MEDPVARIAELAEQIEGHRDAYYRGAPSIPDSDYDALEDELRALLAEHPELTPADNPLDRPGAPAALRGETVRHRTPMLSLEKSTTPEQIGAFVERFPGQPLKVTPKLDGLSLSLVYEDGALSYAATRGDGTTGEVVTHAIRTVVPGLPDRIDAPGRVEVRGEAVMLRSTFAAYNERHPDKPLINPRNGAAGTLMHKDPAACAEAGRLLTFFAFDTLADGDLDEADLGFDVPDRFATTGLDDTVEAVRAIEQRRPDYDYDIDGAVIRLASRAAFDAAGANSSSPRGALAFKYPPEERTTTLLAVTWPVGKIGRVPPRAQLEPVFVGGTTVTYATLHNPRLIAERDIRIGDTVIVRRAGDVIPFIAASVPAERDGTEQVIEPPTHCPSCGTELVVRGTGEERWCENLQCPAQATRRLIHWASRPAADMEGVGDTWIVKLADDGVLERPADFYGITTELLTSYERMGEVSAANMVAAIERSKALGMRRALIGLAIPMASDGTAKRLCLAGFERVEDVAAASTEELEAIRDIGPKVAASIHAYFARPEVVEELELLRAAGVDLDVRDEDRPVDVAAAADTPLKGATVVVTGTIRHPASGQKIARPEFVRLVEQAGATNASSVSGETAMLITGENVGAAKTGKAEKLGVDVVDQGQVWTWLADAGVA